MCFVDALMTYPPLFSTFSCHTETFSAFSPTECLARVYPSALPVHYVDKLDCKYGDN